MEVVPYYTDNVSYILLTCIIVTDREDLLEVVPYTTQTTFHLSF